jgi:hypothetical protein
MDPDLNTPHKGDGARTGSAETDKARAAVDETVESVASQARSAAEQQKESGAEQLGGVARAIHGAARELEDQMPQAARFVHDAAKQLDGAAGALRERSIDDLMQSFNRFARAQPLAFFGGAVLAGFAVSRFLKSSGQTSGGRHSHERQA